MSSSDDLLDIEFGLRTTPEDVEALRKHRPAPMSFAAYLDFLSRFPHPPTEELRQRRGPCGERFLLPDPE